MTKLNKETRKAFQLEPFFELSHDLLCIAGYDGYFKKVNPAFKKLLGYPNEVLYSWPVNDFVHPQDKDATTNGRNGLRENRPLLNFENRYVKCNGEVVWLSWTSIPVDSEQLVYAIAKNITHIKKLESERNQLLSHFSKTNQNLKLLTYSTSHDLRSPVANLQMIFDLLDLSKIHDQETLDILDLLKTTTVNLTDTLNSYLETLEAQSGDVTESELEVLNLNEIFTEVRKSIDSLVTKSAATFHIDFSAFETLRFKRSYLESIFLNLITNSIKYGKAGQPPEISISSHLQNGQKQLIFSDKGKGFDMEKVSGKIFGLHQKFSDHGDSKGIGLYLVHNHVTSLGGSIEVESGLNEGATFRISFKD